MTGRTSGSVLSPPSTKAARVVSADPADHPVPTGLEEEWRFTPIKRLTPLMSGEPATVGAADVTWTAEGATVSGIGSDDPRIGSVFTPNERPSAIARAQAPGALLVHVAPETTAAAAHLRVRGRGGIDYAHLFVDIEHHAEATIVLDHTGTITSSANVELRVGDGATLTFVSIQDWDGDAIHLSTQAIRLGRDARVRHIVVTLGGSLVRIAGSVGYDAPGGSAQLLGAYFADAGQHLEHRLFVDHAVPHCSSDVVYKGALQGHGAHTVWIGDVLIRAAATGTQTYEINRNLVLTDGTRADSVPNLEIETGDVAGAGHASATGRFDDEQLFYLQSRGIPEDEARRLVVRGFFADLVHNIGIASIGDRLLEVVDAKLTASIPGAGPTGGSVPA